MRQHTIIVGGGLAGLAAAVALADRGVQVTLLESRPRLGGRAGSFLDKQSGEWIDACQHVAMGCCTNLQHFSRTVGITDLFQTEEELTFIDPQGRRSRLRSRPWPAPLHLSMSTPGRRLADWRIQYRFGTDVLRLAHPRWAEDRGLSFLDWLEQHGRTLDLRAQFWEPILVSALSETLDRIALPYARKVFVDGFLANRQGWRVQLPRVPLDELYGQSVRNWLTSRSAVIRTNSAVTRLQTSGDAVTAIELRGGDTLAADEYIVAVPWYRLLDLLPASLQEHPQLSGVRQLQSAPISSVHLWFDRDVLDVPHAVLTGRLSQWVFKRSEEQGARSGEQGAGSEEPGAGSGEQGAVTRERGYIQVVISASRNIVGQPPQDVIDDVLRELQAIWPAMRAAVLLQSRVITEHRSVFSPLPGVDALRPVQQSPIGNLQLAGDWTRTGWPATMEGAVRSGYLAAANVLRRLGQPASLLQPDLPVGPLARSLLNPSP